MGKETIKDDIQLLLHNLVRDFPNKSPYIFGKGFGKSNLTIFEADEEVEIPGAICINAYVLDLLEDHKTMNKVSRYMDKSGRSILMGRANVNRCDAMMLMVSCVNYSFNGSTFPYLNNSDINQMWADLGQMTKGDHVVCTIISLAMRGRSYEGFTKRHATRHPVPPVSILDVPRFEPPLLRQQPPPPPRVAGARKPFASALDNKRVIDC
jgi:hypothetical protein